MPKIVSFDVCATDIPFKKPFKHAAAERNHSNSIFVKCTLDTDVVGFGESLPREYVTGESRDGAYALLVEKILPNLIGRSFESLADVIDFLAACDGKAPSAWVGSDVPQTAAWCAVDLALLDAYARASGVSVGPIDESVTVSCSGVVSAEKGMKTIFSALKMRLFGLKSIKIKVSHDFDVDAVKKLRCAFGGGADLRVDANMAWTVDEALIAMKEMSRYGITSFEQPLPADDIDGLARLTAETGLTVMVDESITDKASLDLLIEKNACNAVNVRISKCGGLIAASKRIQEAVDAGMLIQVGCQVGETSLLSVAQRILVTKHSDDVQYVEGCFGNHLLKEDPVEPLQQFGFGGNVVPFQPKEGFGVSINKVLMGPCVAKHEEIK